MKINPKVISFFKKHNIYNQETFEYIEHNITEIDYHLEEQRTFVGCFYTYDKHNKLNSIHINIPYAYDDETILINIHEITHAIILYRRLGKKYNPNITEESLPLMFEKLYILENYTESLEAYGKYLDELIYSENEPPYLFGLSIREKLISNYDGNIDKTLKYIKKLSKEYHQN